MSSLAKLSFVILCAFLGSCGGSGGGGGGQKSDCDPGAARCSPAGHVETCDANGSAWSQTESCPAGCEAGSCLPACGCDTDATCQAGCECDPDCGLVTVEPTTIDDLLVNPGMGSADFHFRWWCNLPPVTFTPEECVQRWHPDLDTWPENMPAAGTAYFRWHWADIEPVRGQISWDLIDATLQTANLLGETLSIRIMTIDDNSGMGVPAWLVEAPYDVPMLDFGGTLWPDYRDATFQAEHARMVTALAERYNQHPGIDHLDIGTVGCWGEWNTACLDGVADIFEVFSPQNSGDYQAIVSAYQALISHYTEAFQDTPLVMLGLGSQGGHELEVMVHALTEGTGWRVDCWGDWWNFSHNWSHQNDLYPAMIANMTAAYPAFPDTWQHAPVQLEICGTMPGWHDLGYTTEKPDGAVTKSFQWAQDQHASLLNLKSGNIHADYVEPLNGLLNQNGYRFEAASLSHPEAASPGDEIIVSMIWRNTGVAPAYNRRTLSVRLHNADRQEVFDSDADIRQWLPGDHQVDLTLTLPAQMPAGDYHIDVALRDRAATDPDWSPLPPLQLGTAGRMGDGWTRLSQITIQPAE